VKLHINDALPSQRAILMRPKMQQDIASKSGATITMVGVPYEKAELPAVKKTDPPPVYLEVGANDQSQVDRAVAMIGEILSDTPLPDPRSLSEQKLDMQNFHRKKLFIGLDDANPGLSGWTSRGAARARGTAPTRGCISRFRRVSRST
jgi:hypothetical protein